jgi:hypothetical protein
MTKQEQSLQHWQEGKQSLQKTSNTMNPVKISNRGIKQWRQVEQLKFHQIWCLVISMPRLNLRQRTTQVSKVKLFNLQKDVNNITYEDARMVASKVANKAYDKASQLKTASFDFFA